jgi:hypothetical protein
MARREYRQHVLTVEALVSLLSHPTTDGGMSWATRRGRVHEDGDCELLFLGVQVSDLRTAYNQLAELFDSAVHRVPQLESIHTSVRLLSQNCNSDVDFAEIMESIDESYFSEHAASSDQLWHGFRWRATWSAYYMVQQLLELSLKLQKPESNRMPRFREVVRAARSEAAERRNEECTRIIGKLHARFVNVAAQGVTTLKSLVDILREDDDSQEKLPEFHAARRGRGAVDAMLSDADLQSLAGKLSQRMHLSPPPVVTAAPSAQLAAAANSAEDGDRASETYSLTGPTALPPPTAENPELKAIMNEPGFEEQFKALGVKVTRKTPSVDACRILESDVLPRLRGVRVPWHDLANMNKCDCSDGKGEWGLECPICLVCNTRMKNECTFSSWVSPGAGQPTRTLGEVPRETVITHTLFQCFALRMLVERAAKERTELAWMTATIDNALMARMITAAVIYQQRRRRS